MPQNDQFTLTIHMVCSLDGIIAKPDNSVAWFDTGDHYEPGATVTEAESKAFLDAIDCYVMGALTYVHALALSKDHGWAYGDKPTIVLSHRDLVPERPSVKILSGDLGQVVEQHLKPFYKNVWVVGGAMLCRDFIRLKLADELRLSIMPVMLVRGLPFLSTIETEQALHLKNVTAYKTGMVELVYEVKK